VTGTAVLLAACGGESDGDRSERAEQSTDGVARPRPGTPACPAITDAFSRAFPKVVIDRAAVKATLDEAVEAIDKDLAAHDGYPENRP
jgi:multiple sugar transport system substrate-binding protein